MQRDEPRWRADRGARAVKTLNEIKASIAPPPAEDFLDLHDIFVGSAESPLGTLAFDGMRCRSLLA